MEKALSEEMVERLKKEVNNIDIEFAHINADDILCELLKKLGYDDVVDEYEKVYRAFA